ncbi:NAD(P)-binding protein [Pholiota conissans]|uniref:NAD(P)-binding protein n=1 Tax=Pholiota conissans TaxID=109636 RepID=A0A9P5ZEX0_9AGAR|nr:NAD(P)-binding protein [Pholiota conissans]
MAKTAIITGASSGIGRHTAVALSKAGWNIVLTARRLGALKETESLCQNETLILAGDITDEPFVKGVFETAVAHFGRLDLLFNNAGVSAKQVPIENMSLETFQTVIDVNLIGCFLTTREAMRVFKSQSPQGGRIINNGSLSAHVPRPHSFPYTCSKHAITGLTKCTALDGRSFGITCTQIDIGNAHTDMAKGHIVGAMQADGSVAPEPTMDVEHIANTIVHIASLPPDVAMLEVNIMAAGAPYVGRG